MEVEDIQGVLETIFDLHDKLSDAIHSSSRAHFFNTLQARKAQTQARTQQQEQQQASDEFYNHLKKCDDGDNRKSHRTGSVFMKDYAPVEVDDSAVNEAKSLNSIRTALENLEYQLEFLQTVRTQQQAERDAAIAHLEQSRIVLAIRLAEHHGNKYKVIEEARAFVGDVHDASRFISPENLDEPASAVSRDSHERKRSNVLNFFLSKVDFIKKSIRLHQMGEIIGNAALVAISMLVLMHVQQVDHKDKYKLNLLWSQEEAIFKRGLTKVSRLEKSSSADCSTQLDVQLARG